MKNTVTTSYRSLNDAGEALNLAGLRYGSTEIWYARASTFAAIQSHSMSPDEKVALLGVLNGDLSSSHVLLGTVAETDLERIFVLMQGEIWSPQGEARTLLLRKGLGHTSMSMGDIVRAKGKLYICASMGWITNDGTHNSS